MTERAAISRITLNKLEKIDSGVLGMDCLADVGDPSYDPVSQRQRIANAGDAG